MSLTFELTSGDSRYILFRLLEEDPETLLTTPFDLTNAERVIFRMRERRSKITVVEGDMSIINPSQGEVRYLLTVPAPGSYVSDVKVVIPPQTVTFIGPVFYVRPQLG